MSANAFDAASQQRMARLCARWREDAEIARKRCEEGWDDIDEGFEAAKYRTLKNCAAALEAELAGTEPNDVRVSEPAGGEERQ